MDVLCSRVEARKEREGEREIIYNIELQITYVKRFITYLYMCKVTALFSQYG
jgi:hypothetical protein